jgi:cyclophilin family peptidyl-prolyl cis-trans isomerase
MNATNTAAATDAEGGLKPETIRRFKRYALLIAAVLLALGVFAVWRFVSEGKGTESWEDLARIDRVFGESSTRSWTEPVTSAADAAARDEHIRKLEDFLAKHGSSDAVAADVHAEIANLQMAQIAGLLAGSPATDVTDRIASARQHLETLLTKYPDAPINQERFRTPSAPSLTHLLLSRLASVEKWQAEHGIKPVEPDADPVVVLRTTEGDLRLRFFSGASPELVRSFVDRACNGALDGTLLFEKHDDATEAWVRGGDPRTKDGEKAADEVRMTWGAPSTGNALLPEEGRNRILHARGIVSAWHERGEIADDPYQFVLVLKPSTRMDYAYTPFARVDGEASLSTLERITARRSRVQEKPDLRGDAKWGHLADQLASPVAIRKALVYEKGALKACHDASKVDESERRLDTLKLDAYKEAPPPPPAPPAAPGGMEAPPAMTDK